MLPVKVKYSDRLGWIGVQGGHTVTEAKNLKDDAVDAAVGWAQTKADQKGITVAVEIFSKENQYMRTKNVNPAP